MVTQADENLRGELEVDVNEECSKIGVVDSVKVSDEQQMWEGYEVGCVFEGV